jgi:hypothetical protein
MDRRPVIPELDQIALTHGSARWVLKHAGLLFGADEGTENSYFKSLRRNGIPFSPDELGVGTGGSVIYRYEHLMEVALALALRDQGILSRHIVELIAHDREILRPLFIEAYDKRDRKEGKQDKIVQQSTGKSFAVGGLYLDLRLEYLPNGTLSAIKPELLSAFEAIGKFASKHQTSLGPYRPPIPISDIAEIIVRFANEAPEVRRGRP